MPARRSRNPRRALSHETVFADPASERLVSAYVARRSAHERLAGPKEAALFEATLRRAIAERVSLEIAARPHLGSADAVQRVIIGGVTQVTEKTKSEKGAGWFHWILELVAAIPGIGAIPRMAAVILMALKELLSRWKSRPPRATAAVNIPVAGPDDGGTMLREPRSRELVRRVR